MQDDRPIQVCGRGLGGRGRWPDYREERPRQCGQDIVPQEDGHELVEVVV